MAQVCCPCLDAWIDECLDTVERTAAVVAATAGADVFAVGQDLFETWDLTKLIPELPHECLGVDCRCRCPKAAA